LILNQCVFFTLRNGESGNKSKHMIKLINKYPEKSTEENNEIQTNAEDDFVC